MFEVILSFIAQPASKIVFQLYALGGYLIFAWLLSMGGFFVLKFYKNKRYTSTWKWVLLAIDIPPMNLQTPKAVEQLFAHIFSVMESPAIGTVFRRGFQQFSFSFEIISIDGYIQFLVRTIDNYRDVVEAAIYAQYPEAEIFEVEDYTESVPRRYPNDTHNLWAAEFSLVNHYAYPLRVYRDFEHTISKDEAIKDSMGTFLESFSRIGPGEQMWFQLIIEPIPDKVWKMECIKEIKKVAGEKVSSSKGGFMSSMASVPLSLAKGFGEQMIGSSIGSDGSAKPASGGGGPNNVQYLTPGQKNLLEAMENKISKIGYKSKIRMVYAARNEVFNPAHGVNSLIGAINQFSVPSSNALLPKYLTSVRYFGAQKRKAKRQNTIINDYRNRDITGQLAPYVLNLEELATLWHFPLSHSRVPKLQKAGPKKTEPPTNLPFEQMFGPFEPVSGEDKNKDNNSGYRTDAGDTIRR